jgi:hypothetical protein
MLVALAVLLLLLAAGEYVAPLICAAVRGVFGTVATLILKSLFWIQKLALRRLS